MLQEYPFNALMGALRKKINLIKNVSAKVTNSQAGYRIRKKPKRNKPKLLNSLTNGEKLGTYCCRQNVETTATIMPKIVIGNRN